MCIWGELKNCVFPTLAAKYLDSFTTPYTFTNDIPTMIPPYYLIIDYLRRDLQISISGVVVCVGVTEVDGAIKDG